MRPNRAIDFCKITKIEDKLPFLPKQDWYKADWHRTARSADLVPELRNTNSQTQVLKIVSFSSYLNSVSLCDLLLILCFWIGNITKKYANCERFFVFFGVFCRLQNLTALFIYNYVFAFFRHFSLVVILKKSFLGFIFSTLCFILPIIDVWKEGFVLLSKCWRK